MTTRQRLRKIGFWTAVAIPVLAAMYVGAYYRMVTSVSIITVAGANPVPILQTQPRYYFPWPIPDQYNQSELQPKIETVFAPAHQMDRWLRPGVWIRKEAVIQVRADGTGVLVSE